MSFPVPTPILRITHLDNLRTLLKRQGLHAPSRIPSDGLPYRSIHHQEIQKKRSKKSIPCGPEGNLIDYVPFYFGYLSPMLLMLHTGKVDGYVEGQKNIIYLIASVQKVLEIGSNFVFSDGHGLQHITKWYASARDLDKIHWPIVNQKQWADHDDDTDRQRKKQAEFLVYEYCPWFSIEKIVVIDLETQKKVLGIFNEFPIELHRETIINKKWYY